MRLCSALRCFWNAAVAPKAASRVYPHRMCARRSTVCVAPFPISTLTGQLHTFLGDKYIQICVRAYLLPVVSIWLCKNRCVLTLLPFSPSLPPARPQWTVSLQIKQIWKPCRKTAFAFLFNCKFFVLAASHPADIYSAHLSCCLWN